MFGKPINALILFETFTQPNISGPVTTQQSGFLIGPFNGYGYKIIHEKISYGAQNNRSITDNGLKVFAHPSSGATSDFQGVELNRGQYWRDGKNESWVYHWSALAKIHEVLKELKYHLNNNYVHKKQEQ